jgi:hypothetical protein
MENRARWLWLAPALMATVFAGCPQSTPDVMPVKGKVTLDGQPLTKGAIGTLPPAGRGANGIIGPDGTFELTTYAKGDGARLGLHKVSVTSYDMVGTGPEAVPGKSLIPTRYTNPQTSGLTIEVTEDGPNEPVLELSSK